MTSLRTLHLGTVMALLAIWSPAQTTAKARLPHKAAERTAKGLRQHQRLARPAYGSPAGRGAAGPATALEVERNESIGFADDFGSSPDYDGDIAFPGDSDVVRLQVTTNSVVTFDVAQAGSNPISDATLLLRDANGQFVAFNDDRPSSLLPLITLPLPAGDYYAVVEGYGGSVTGTYKLTTTITPTSFASASLNGATSGSVPPGGEVAFRVSLTVDTALSMSIASNGGQDLYCVLLRPSGAVQRFVDDGTSASTDPSLATHLPGNAAGDYILVFGDFNGLGGPLTFNITSTPQAIPTLACGTSVNGSVLGSEGEAMYSVALTAATGTALSVAGSSMTDSFLTLYDAHLNTVLYDDDDVSSLFSAINVGLPAGQYYVGVASFDNTSAGTFTLSLGCTNGFVPTAGRFGENAGSIVNPNDTVALKFTPGTPIAMETSVALGALFPMSAILDRNGICRSFTDFADFEVTGAKVDGGEHWVLVRDYFGSPGAFSALIAGPMYFFGTAKGSLTLQDKAGRIHFPYAAVGTLPVGFPVPAPFTGSLLLVPPLIAVPAQAIPATGTTVYPFSFPNGAYFLQGLSVVPAPLGGAMTNVAD
ncbi:MAG: hypothetical protein R3F56_15930 [Planctomycetota bacterium]